MHVDAFVDGRHQSGDDAAVLVRTSPIDGVTTVGTVAALSPRQTAAAIDAAHEAQAAWSRIAVHERVRLVRSAIDDALATGHHTGDLIAAEMGKPAREADGEFVFAQRFAQFCGDQAVELCRDTRIDDDEGTLVRIAEPRGTVAAITPWNAPVILASLKLIPALMTGNTVVLKPSPLAPLAVTLFIADIASRLPRGVLNVINGDNEAGEALVSHPRIDMISFTGGPTTARIIGATAAKTITPTVMELGGNDAAILLDDAPWGDEMAERIIFGAFLTSGQVCMAIKRVYVPRAQHDAFVERLIDVAERVLHVGDPRRAGVTMGPVIDESAKTRLETLIESARHSGATIHPIGTVHPEETRSGSWVHPVLVTNVSDEHTLVAEEQFGPVLPILPYDTLEEAIGRANSVEHGLGSSVWSADEQRAFEVARSLRAGFTFINCANRAGVSLRAPMGGRGISGHGREFGDLGVAEYVQNHSVNYPTTARPDSRMAANHYPGSTPATATSA